MIHQPSDCTCCLVGVPLFKRLSENCAKSPWCVAGAVARNEQNNGFSGWMVEKGVISKKQKQTSVRCHNVVSSHLTGTPCIKRQHGKNKQQLSAQL